MENFPDGALLFIYLFQVFLSHPFQEMELPPTTFSIWIASSCMLMIHELTA